jgi:hypothetical protein
MTGEADNYYNNNGQYQTQVPPPAFHQGGSFQGPPQSNHPQVPPNYAQNVQNVQDGGDLHGGFQKQSFEQTFKLDKPKYNDLWAGILVGLHQNLHAEQG